jgi:JAB N-terminal domain
MRAEIELYKGWQYAYFGSLSITALIVGALRDKVDGDALTLNSLTGTRRTRVVLHFRDPADLAEPARVRPVSELNDSLGSLRARFEVDGELVHAGTYGMGLMGNALTRLLDRIDPDENDWAFAFRNLSQGADLRPTPDVEGTVDVDMRQDARPPAFSVQQVEAPVAEGVDAAELGIDPATLGRVNVLVSGHVHDLILMRLPLSERIEEGGFLLGRIRPAADGPGRQFAQITHVTPASQAGASAVHFTFTPDSFKDVNQRLSERDQDEELVGWYHTHLFPATTNIGTATGLSTIDIDTHSATFRRSGQVAGLINIFDNRRVLRFYSKVGDEMEECQVWIGDERGRYRAASTDVGRR